VEDLQDTIREAFRIASSGRPGPVLVDIPKDVQMALYEYEDLPPVGKDEKAPAKEIRIREAAECIRFSQRPYIYIGGGVLSGDASEDVLRLAELLDAPIGSSMMGLSAIPTDHPRFLGMQGMHGHYASSMAMHKADCILALGVRFNDRVTGNKAKFARGAKIIHIDIDGAELEKTVSVAHGLRGDVKLTLRSLMELLEKQEHPQWQAQVEEFRREEAASYPSTDAMTPKNVLELLDTFILKDTVIATDVGQHQMWAAQYAKFHETRTFVTSGGLGTMGFGMGAAIGAAVGTGKRTVLITGDGSFGMNLNEMATAVSQNVPLVIVLFNNGVLGMVRQWQTLFFQGHYSQTVLQRKTDFVKLAEAFGATAARADDLNGLREALNTAFAHDGPFLIDCRIDKDEFVLLMLPPGGSMDDIIVKVGD